MMSKQILRFFVWRNKHIPHKYFVMMLAVLIGFTSGLATVLIKNIVYGIQHLLTSGFDKDAHHYMYFVYPLIGILLTVTIVKYLIRSDVGHGIPNVLYAISKRKSMMKKRSMIASIITSAITVSFGGSVGLEGPTVSTSGAVGSNIGRLLRVNYKTKTLLIGCACAGAMAALFKAPIAAIVFAIEVIMLDLTMASLIPLLLASVAGVLTSRFFLGDELLLSSVKITSNLAASDIPFYLLLGAFTGLFSVYFSKMYFFISWLFEKVKKVYVKALVAGLALGLILFLLPSLYGEGYETINALIQGNFKNVMHNSPFYEFRDNITIVLITLMALTLLKVVATSLTFGGGGIGGIFGPTLFVGSTLGFVFAKFFNHFGLAKLSQTNFTLVAMSGLMAGVLYAPLTAIFLIAEITGGYELFVPLMITAVMSYLTVRFFVPNSIYTAQLAKRGELITHHKDQAVLTLMKLRNEIETNFETVWPKQTLGDLVHVVAKSNRNLFPVVDAEGMLLGYVSLNDIREVMFNKGMYKSTLVEDLMVNAPATLTVSEDMETVMGKFESTGAWNLPVVDEGKYIGFVSKSKLFNAYRKQLRDFYEE